MDDGSLSLSLAQAEKKMMGIMDIARENKIDVQSISMHKPTLDDVFLHYTGRNIREEAFTGKDAMRMRRKAWGRGR